MNETQMLERLTSAYATLEVPAPTAALAVVLDAGGVVHAGAPQDDAGDDARDEARDEARDDARDDSGDDARRGAVVLPLRPHRTRMRHLVAAAVATFVLFSGLAVAGALPDGLQRRISSAASHIGIDLPSPDSGSGHSSDDPHGRDRPVGASDATPARGSGSGPSSGSGSGAPGDTTGGGAAASPGPTAVPGGLPLGGLGGATGTTPPTTLPPSGVDGLPPLTLPPLTLPPVSVPQLTVPQLTVPQLTVPQLTVPLTLPPLTAPLPIQLPGLGL